MINMAQYCPYAEKCPFHQNWAEQTKDRRLDVIVTEGEGSYYDCLALIALDDPETGIAMSDDLKYSLADPKMRGCSHITLLNLLKNTK